MYIKMLDYSVTVPSVNGQETANFFGEHPIYGTVGYPTYEDAANDMHSILGFGQFLDCVESYIANGLIGDHYVFNPQNMIVEIVNEYEGWDWTPETGIIPWESETDPEPEVCLNRKQHRAVRIDCNKSHKGSDRAHGKRRPVSRKDFRHAERQELRKVGSNAHIPFLWATDLKGNYVPVRVERHKREERFVPSPDWDGDPDPLMPAERLERNQQIEQLKNQLDITDWEMRDVTDRIQWCREDIEEIEYFKSKEAETRQSLKEWQDRLATLSREYHDLTERILNLSV